MKTINLYDIPWRQDSITRRYIRENADILTSPASMTPLQLAEAQTYCRTTYTPYASELASRAGLANRLSACFGDQDKRTQVIIAAAKAFNITMV